MNKVGLDTTELMFSLAIALLYPFFFFKLVNRMTGYDEINDMCNHIKYDWRDLDQNSIQNKQYNACSDEKSKKLEKVEFHKHVMLLVIALIGIVLTSVIQTKSTKFGVGLGGVFTLLCALTIYWYRYNENTKLMVLGLSLLFVVFFSVRLYKIDNIADIFSVEFGTK
ncbi:hypothetical protein QKU48_gp0904 [Fadolivirus algeromassiliense]|jgi:hypothetical protein|uniref:Uncharacterized protein n=1 Tax=Fadolivirus FV1/VV64 TaxID=3070911 RepID=A0A7D3R1A8_9VIRU|nr:hypothetical protein QKU48_gp0904 [Fadolivirus algeromassiliense]QKF94362.1 hypothetical protein Fadolivirus_1_904 [Fadolivirus FV1/VV64]